MKITGVFEEIKNIVKQIPRGKVTTYGTIANILGLLNPRVVGWAIHGNTDPNIPCHRVVKKNGFLATGFIGGPLEQKSRLEKDGIKFNDQNQVDMDKCFWTTTISYTPLPKNS